MRNEGNMVEPADSPLDALLHQQHIVICCGCGGVGKTTTSAALGIKAAELGRKVMVLTIDPAKRLADSLGIGELTNDPKLVPLPPSTPGTMWAMMLDVKRTLDAIILENAPTPEQAHNVLKNHIYQQLSQNLGGGQEYGAMERLFQIHSEGEYDLIVLDTPPSQHALDFIVAPLNLKEFFSQSVLKFFLAGTEQPASSLGSQWSGKSKNLVLKLFEKMTGSHFLKDLADFLRNFQGMYEPFREQAGHVSDLLESPETAFLIVSSPEKQQLAESQLLHQKLQEFRLPCHGLIVNKCTPTFQAQLASDLPSALRHELEHLIRQNARHAAYEHQLLQALTDTLPDSVFVHNVPIFPKDVYNLATLMDFSRCL